MSNKSLNLVDKDGEWFINTGAFRLVDADTGHYFESGTKYLIRESEWMKSQPTIVPTTPEDEDIYAEVLEPQQPGQPMLNLEGGVEEGAAAVARTKDVPVVPTEPEQKAAEAKTKAEAKAEAKAAAEATADKK